MASNNDTVSEHSADVQMIISEYLAAQTASEETDSQVVESQSILESFAFDKETFLQALREFKGLWDTSDANYKNRNMKVNAWNTLSKMFNQEGNYYFFLQLCFILKCISTR